ncbi:MAG: hypothetical protein COV43_02715 [Deltaproteobacteria bacterium CG11_big_fil_rev_8_21_14_0_20_42_23]|nr:MAG: hypothetical protein COV43_02715 [Deltaproteobacteria bacterium CG11_big_fil_rev_8_21_14_0_20_42_23]PJC64594.1 MAG: hypothetical protein CO021_03525 [Deltaproteobacteria bacterium CG_4_9_14_0_2_um_filter_42_21]
MNNPLHTLVQDAFRSDDEKQSERNLFHSFLLSFLAHVFIVLLFVISTTFFDTPSTHEEQVVEIIPVSEDSEVYKLADIAPPQNQSRPKSARFAGAYDSTVERETVRKKNTHIDSRDPGNAERKAAKKYGAQKNIYDFDKSLFYKQKIAQARNEGVLSVDIGGGGSEDYFPDYTHADHTYLNVHRFLHLDYFVRLKRAFRLTFSPGNVAFPRIQKQYSTVVGVAVDAKGELTELILLRSSGLTDYDQEVFRTVKASSPFSSPPHELLQKDGVLRMGWTFIVPVYL